MRTSSVLIVDDRLENLISLEKILEEIELEIDVYKASSGQEALMFLLEHSIDCLLVDVKMPNMDGFELAEIVHKDPKLSAIPIIFATAAMVSQADIYKGYQCGGVDYLIKPLEPSIVISKVTFFLKQSLQRKKISEVATFLDDMEQNTLRSLCKLLEVAADSDLEIFQSKDGKQLLEESTKSIETLKALALVWKEGKLLNEKKHSLNYH